MKRSAKARTLAKRFLNSIGTEKAPAAIRELFAFSRLMEQSEEFSGLLLNPLFSLSERSAGLKAVGRALGVSDETLRFVGYLAETGAARVLGEVAMRAEAIYAEQMKLSKATVVTPAPVGDEYSKRLGEALRALTGRDVEIEYVTDPELLGGMLVKVGSTMYDGSLKGQLRLLRSELIKG